MGSGGLPVDSERNGSTGSEIAALNGYISSRHDTAIQNERSWRSLSVSVQEWHKQPGETTQNQYADHCHCNRLCMQSSQESHALSVICEGAATTFPQRLGR